MSDALWSYEHAAARFPRRRSRSGCRCPRFSRPSRWPWPRARPSRSSGVRAGGRPSSPARSCRSSPGASPRTSPLERGLPTGRARTLAVGTGLTAAVYLPLLLHSLAARLDDAVRRARPRRGLLMSASCAIRAAPGSLDPRARRDRPAHRPRGADAQRGRLARPHVGVAGLAASRGRPRGSAFG